MKHTQRLRGFTLIELLVVIAIIGILASVVLASLNSARDKGSNAAIKAGLNGVRAQADLYRDDAGGTYEVTDGADSVCFNDESATPKGVASLVSAVELETPAIGDVLCNDDPTSWAVAAQLVGDSAGDYFCMDSTGTAKEVTGATVGVDFTTDLVCP